MSQQFTVTPDVTPGECHWLYETIPSGTTVYRCLEVTYGCIGNGQSCTFDPDGGYPFFELPHSALAVADAETT